MMRKLVGVVVVGLAAGCSGGLPFLPGSSTSSSGGGEQPLTVATYLDALNEASCGFDDRCVNLRGRAFSSVAACRASNADRNQLYRLAYGVDAVGYYETHFNFDAVKAKACVDKQRARACNDTAVTDVDCSGALTPRAAQANGAQCNGELDSTALVCSNDSACDYKDEELDNTCFVCLALKADGQTCGGGDECVSGFCSGGTDGTDGSCGPSAPKQKAQPCFRDDECLGALICTGTAANKICAERVALNAQCDVEGGEGRLCQVDLECVPTTSGGMTGTCQTPLADGAACQRNVVSGANCAHLCIFATADAASGTCGWPTALPGPGQACVGLNGDARICALDDAVYPDFDVVVSNMTFEITRCECKTSVPTGGTCKFNEACVQPGRCVGGGFDFQTGMFRMGSCGAQLANGQNCRGDLDCQSEWCVPVSANMAQCQVKPACP